MPHTLEYNYSLPSPTPVPETQVAVGRSIPDNALDPWYFNTVAAPMLQDVKAEDKMDVAAPSVGNLFNPGGTLAARSGIPPYFFLDVASSSSGGDPSTGFFARDTRGSHCMHEGEGPPGSSSCRDAADASSAARRRQWTGTPASVAQAPGTRRISASQARRC